MISIRLLALSAALSSWAGGWAQTGEKAAPDAFAAIALETPPPQRGGLRENRPAILPPIELESVRSDDRIQFGERPVLRNAAEFRAQLAALRQRFQPFLEDHTPPLPATRARAELDTFDFRMEEEADRQDITRIFRGEGEWRSVRIPHYQGPVGWWSAWYRKTLRVPPAVAAAERMFLRFLAVDYRCQVYVNGRMVKAHEGFFAPFEVDVTPFLWKDRENVLAIRIENESIPITVHSWKGPNIDGDKLYAAVGPGWDEPGTGWHHCPPGAGIWQRVYLEGRPRVAITDVFVRPDWAAGAIEARIEVYQPDPDLKEIELKLSVYPANFQGPRIAEFPVEVQPAGPGFSEYRARIELRGFRSWTPDEPFLYTLRAEIRPKRGGNPDAQQTRFGMREFRMDDHSPVKGAYYLNGEPVILRGANTMGHFMTAVMRGDRERLIEDVLIGKLANMNFFRLTQSPVPTEVYEVCDRLGMMLQTDLPLFGFLRRPQLVEAIKQAGEMERLIRGHASSIQVSYINEPFSPDSRKAGHRQLTRAELEEFFTAASAVIRTHNPDRVIKPVDGDYDPPAPGLPDNHIYSTWYGSHAVPIGKFIRGYWVSQKPGWKFGSGEYGVEGLEDAETMFRHYPKDWVPASLDARWNPDKIASAQTWTMHHGWFDAQDTMREWIAASQAHQAWGIREMTRAFRRQSDRIVSTAVHLLLDTWPAGWMKSLVDVDRRPKPAYFEFREALTPLLADIRADRRRYFSGEPLAVEFWVANDRRAPREPAYLVWEVWQENRRVFVQRAAAVLPSFGAAFQGYFRYRTPAVQTRQSLRLRLGLQDSAGRLLHDSEMTVEVFPAPRPERAVALIVGEQEGRAWRLAGELGWTPQSFGSPPAAARIALVDQPAAFEPAAARLLEWVRAGGTALFLEQETAAVWRVEGSPVQVKPARGKEFVSRKTGHPLVSGFQPFDFAYWYDPAKDFIEYTATAYLEGAELRPILITGRDAQAGDPYALRVPLPVVAERGLGKGRLIFSQLRVTGRVNVEPPAREFLERCLMPAR